MSTKKVVKVEVLTGNPEKNEIGVNQQFENWKPNYGNFRIEVMHFSKKLRELDKSLAKLEIKPVKFKNGKASKNMSWFNSASEKIQKFVNSEVPKLEKMYLDSKK